MWFWKIMRRFFLSLDSVLFNFIDVLYDLLMSISRTSILTQGEIAQFAQRIELLLGIFMLFKLAFSLITYIVNPDDFSDKQKGFGKLIQSAVISLLMLVLVPYIFQMAFNLQTKVLEGNVLAKLILGEDDEADGNDNFLNTAGEEMAFSVMLPFFKPNYSINNSSGVDLADCINIYESQGDKNVFSTKCKTALSKAGMETTPLENYSAGITERSLGLTFRIEAALSTTGDDDTEDFLIDYMAPISTVVAVVVCLLLVTFCIDIGVRNVKLAFLQLIYPIPVISYMDPKNGKDGLFKKWYQMCFSTFLSLFIRLLALYFGVYIISKVGSLGVYDVVTGSQITNGWVMIFVIIGVLMFVKQLPKILENLGIKLDGDGKFTLNPLKKLEEGAIGGKYLSRMPKAAAAGAMGLAMGAVGTATGAGAGKWFTGMASGISGGLKGKKMGELHKGQIDANKRMREAIANGSTFLGRRRAQISGAIGSRGEIGNIEKQIAKFEKEKEEIQNKIAPTKARINKANDTAKSISDIQDRAIAKIKQGKGTAGQEYLKRLRLAEQYDKAGNGRKAEAARQAAEQYLNTTGRDIYINEALANANFDAAMTGMISTYQTNAGISNHTVMTNASALDTQLGNIKGEITADKNSIKQQEVQIADIDDSIKVENEKKRKASANQSAVGK